MTITGKLITKLQSLWKHSECSMGTCNKRTQIDINVTSTFTTKLWQRKCAQSWRKIKVSNEKMPKAKAGNYS